MNPPATVKVGPHTYTVQQVPHGVLPDAGNNGQVNCDQLVIAIDDQLPESKTAEVLLHETIHACLAALPLDDDVEEQVVTLLGVRLLAVVRDNPKLTAFLTG